MKKVFLAAVLAAIVVSSPAYAGEIPVYGSQGYDAPQMRGTVAIAPMRGDWQGIVGTSIAEALDAAGFATLITEVAGSAQSRINTGSYPGHLGQPDHFIRGTVATSSGSRYQTAGGVTIRDRGSSTSARVRVEERTVVLTLEMIDVETKRVSTRVFKRSYSQPIVDGRVRVGGYFQGLDVSARSGSLSDPEIYQKLAHELASDVAEFVRRLR